jgi:sec-independent protein translocase protein TatB
MGTPPTIEMANLGMADSLILMVLALVVFGPRRLPQIGRQIGKLMYEFRKASNDFKFQMEEELRNAEDADRRKKEEERQRALALTVPAQPAIIEAASQVQDFQVQASQVPEAGPGAPAVAPLPSADQVGASPVENPYPGEEQYPSVIAPAAADPAPADEAETYPMIQPPSTGEQVPAARHG